MSIDLLPDRAWVGRYAVGKRVGIETRLNGVLTDVAGDVLVGMVPAEGDGAPIFADRVAEHVDTGIYEVVLNSGDTSSLGLHLLTFLYTLSGVQIFTGYLEVTPPTPNYDALTDEGRIAVERTWIKLGDLFDSPYGGPHLQVYLQTRFDRERLAQLLSGAVGRLNTISQPHQTMSLSNFPWDSWGAVAEQALLVEAIKHLMRSYVEQPDVQGVPTARTDRRDYLDRWAKILDMEKADLDEQLDTFKMAFMGLGSPGVLVSGGLYRMLEPPAMPQYLASRPFRWVATVY